MKSQAGDERSVVGSLSDGFLHSQALSRSVSTHHSSIPLPSAGPKHLTASQSGVRGVAAGGDLWSLELRDLDESIEASLVDPSTSGSLYTRLLVKTVGVLLCEVLPHDLGSCTFLC